MIGWRAQWNGPGNACFRGGGSIFDAGQALLGKMLTTKSLSGLSSGGKENAAVLTGDASVGINQDSAIYSQIAGEPVVAVHPSEGSVVLPEGLGISAKTNHFPDSCLEDVVVSSAYLGRCWRLGIDIDGSRVRIDWPQSVPRGTTLSFSLPPDRCTVLRPRTERKSW